MHTLDADMTTENDQKPRLLLMGDARQVHLKRWAVYFDEAGYDVLSLSLEQTDNYPDEIQFIRMPHFLPGFLKYPLSVPTVKNLVRRFKPHVISAHFAPNYGLIASLVGHQPWVLSTWGSDIMTDPEKSLFHRLRTKFVLRHANRVTSDAQVMTDKIIAMGVPTERVLTFPYGVDSELFYPRRNSDNGGPRIVSNRKLESVYSVSTIIDAFPAVREAFHQATLTVAGDGRLRPALSTQAERSLARRAIVFVGNVDHERMPTLLRDHQVYVSMSLSDTTSVSLLEAMACGLFPVVSDIPANREWIEDGVNGRLVPVEQPMKLAMTIIDAWNDESFRESAVRKNISLISEKAEWRNNMQDVRALFDELVATP
jgi:glycosyltransferase involved in cell wall biosynthesis